MMPKKVLILMATYNGSRYLKQQITSIQNQEYDQWELLIRDDDSCDKTQPLLEEVVREEPRVKLIYDGLGRLGPAGNFGVLMQSAYRAEADYIMFSDQDDVWQPNKISDQMALMENLEKSSPGIPILVHSDLIVTDEKLQKIHPSLMAYQGIQHVKHVSLQCLLVQNFVTGCTCLANRALIEIALPIPKDAIVHDWWLALCAAASGRIAFLPKATVLYRQHALNVIAAKSYWGIFNPFRSSWFRRLKQGSYHLRKSFLQADCLCKRLEERQVVKAPKLFNLVNSYVSLLQLSPMQRFQRLKQLGIHRQDRTRQWVLYVHIMFMRAPDIHE